MNKEKFLRYEFRLLTINAAFSTRGHAMKIYSTHVSPRGKKEVRKILERYFREIDDSIFYRAGTVSEDEHYAFIESIAEGVSREAAQHLWESRFRIGIAQKVANLYLKYLWTAYLIQKPLHCPIDGRIRDKAGLTYDWISSTTIVDYKNAIIALRAQAGTQPLPDWELQNFKRRQWCPNFDD